MSTATEALPAPRPATAVSARLPGWWPLAASMLLAAALRLSTLGLQSFWLDEAYTPMHVLHQSLFSTLHTTANTENNPPLWYIVVWVFYRLFGNGEWALRLPSALAGIALVPVAWAIGRELAGRACAIATAALVAVCPIFVWYSQEARVYSLYSLAAGVLTLAFLRLLRLQDRRRLIEFAAAGAVALLTHYFTAFLLAGMAGWLLLGFAGPELRRRAVPAFAAIGVVGLALVPLVLSQGGRNTGWIGDWPLGERLEALPQYFLVGYNGKSLGYSIQLLVALPLLGACGLAVWSLAGAPPDSEQARAQASHRRAAALTAWLAAVVVLVPLVLALGGKDYLAPRNVLGAFVPATALVAVLCTWPGNGRTGKVLLALGAVGLLVMSIDVNLSPRLQRADWRDAAHAVPSDPSGELAVVTSLYGSSPLEYYAPDHLQLIAPHTTLRVREIVAVAEKPLLSTAGTPPPGFRLVEKRTAHGVVAFRFVAPASRTLSEEDLHRYSVENVEPWVLAPRRRPLTALG